MKRYSLVVLVAVLVMLLSATVVSAGQDKTDVCHLDEEGNYILISIADPALDSHIEHGDAIAGGGVLDVNCEPESIPQEGCFQVFNYGWILTTGDVVQDISNRIAVWPSDKCMFDPENPPSATHHPYGAWLIWATDLSEANMLCEGAGAGTYYSTTMTQTTNLYLCEDFPDPCTVDCEL